MFIAGLALMTLVPTSCEPTTSKRNMTISISNDHDATRSLSKAAIDLVGETVSAVDTVSYAYGVFMSGIQASIQDAGQNLDKKSPLVRKFDIPLKSGENIQIIITYEFLIEESSRLRSLRDHDFQSELFAQTEHLLKGDPVSIIYFNNLNLYPLQRFEHSTYKFQGPVVLSAEIKLNDKVHSFSIPNLSCTLYIGND